MNVTIQRKHAHTQIIFYIVLHSLQKGKWDFLQNIFHYFMIN